jgi:hypothetical protein
VTAEGNVGGGVVLSKSFIYDGNKWTELAPMSVPRANPACSLVDMDDGEVTFCIYGQFHYQSQMCNLNPWPWDNNGEGGPGGRGAGGGGE